MAGQGGGSAEAWSRRLELLRLLMQRGSVQTARAAAWLQIDDKRKARTDLEALLEHGVPLHVEGEGRERRWILQESWRFAGMQVGLQERLGLLVGRELVTSFLHNTDFGDALAELDASLARLGPDEQTGSDDLRRRFHFIHEPRKDYRAHRETLDAVARAVLESHQVSFDYEPASRPGPIPYAHVEPLTLVVYKRGVYLAFLHRERLQTLAVERIRRLRSHPERRFRYPRPSEYDPATHLAERFGIFAGDEPVAEVHLRFEPAVVPFVESREWTPDQELEHRDDGRLDLRFRATGRELVPLVLQFGDKVEVLAPDWLRTRVRDELANALARYRDDAPPPDGRDEREPGGRDEREPGGRDEREPGGLDEREPDGRDEREPGGCEERERGGEGDGRG